jgi:tetratricopeptide (TPR) repeat protein
MNEETLFREALCRPPEDRAAFLEQACAGRPELLAAVQELLAAHEKPGNILDRPPADPGPTVDSEPGPAGAVLTGAYTPQPEAIPRSQASTTDYRPSAAPGAVIAGRYTLVEKLGEGGMGAVWVAKQTEPVKRKVALKLIKAGRDSREVLARFEAERQALALMDHPNIAKILDGGLTPTGQPFFVMELVNGLPLTRFCDEARLTPRQRLELFVPICQAVQHAHHKGIVHRDLKPSNILVTLIDGRGVPKVIDFGVAKATSGQLTEDSLSTQFGAVIGTLEYMSPEQAGFAGADIDTRADIYSLGVILYELLTGLRPLDAKRLRKAALTEMLRSIKEEEPGKPSTRVSTDASAPSLAAVRQTEPKKLAALLRGELDWVVMKCLEKDRNRRYETANGLARDVQHYLADEAVEACPPSAGYRLRKFARKYRTPLRLAGVFALLLVLGAAFSAWQAVRATLAERQALAERDAKEEALRAAKASEAQAKAVLAFFQDKVLTAGRPEHYDGLGRDVTLRAALAAAEPGIATAFRDQPLVEASIRSILGKTYMILGNFELSLRHLERARVLRQAQLGPDHPDTLTSMHDLAEGYQLAGKLGLAVPLHEETLERRKATLGPEHLDTTRSMHLLAFAYLGAGQIDQALPLFEETFRLRKATLGPNHWRTLVTMCALGEAYTAAGKLDRALPLLEESLARARRQQAADALRLGNFMDAVGLCRLHADKPGEAEKVLHECLLIRQKKDPDDWQTFDTHSLLGGALLGQRKYAEAEPHLRQGYEGMKQREATMPAHYKVHLTAALERLVQLYDAWSKKDEAARWRKEAEAAKKASQKKNE